MKKQFLLLFILFSFLNFNLLLHAQTFTDSAGGAISDNLDTTYFTINVSGLNPTIIDSSFGLESICLDITHTKDRDLDIFLESPDGTLIELTTDNGDLNDNYTGTCFRGDVSTSIISGIAPFTGDYLPEGILGQINNGQSGNGIWRLRIYDDNNTGGNIGTLNNWSLTFSSNPAMPFAFTSSNLPIVVINTNNQTIADYPKITCDMGIIYNGISIRNYLTDPFNNYNGKVAIEIRGSSSQWFPKKSYGFETIDGNGTSVDSPLVGMPVESDWILSASYTDKTLMRNVLSYKLYRDMGHYAARTVFCELVIDGQYQGVYILMEKIKRDKNRVAISKLKSTSNAGDSLTGGYIIKVDKLTGNGGQGWTSPYPPPINSSGQIIYFQYDYPKPDSITVQQQTYIQSYVDSFESSLAGPDFADTSIGYKKYISVNSFVDYFILNEISKNVDGYRLSTYLHKDKYSKGGKLKIGPPWDYDIAWWNADYCGGNDTTGWAYQFGNLCPYDGGQIPFWWERLLQDSSFTNKLYCRWQELRQTILDTTNLCAYIDSNANYLNEGQTRNFQDWNIIGTYVWPNPSPLATTYQGEINNLKRWVKNRITWLDNIFREQGLVFM